MATFQPTSGSWELLSASLGNAGAAEQGGHAQHHDGAEAMDVYFECITTCSLDDGECVTRCVEELRNQP
ncbi:MAG: hypothetical protein ACKN89_09740 [Cyanobium sp.]|jgi:hypothetical protein